MTILTKLDDGTEIEALTPEEVEAAKQEAIEAYKAENPDKSYELIALQEELAKKEELLAKANDSDKNFAALRKAKDEAEKKVADILSGIDEKITKAKTEVLEGVMKDHYNDTLSVLAGEDEELKKKIEFNFKRLGDVATTKQEISRKLQDAYALSTTKEDNGVNASVFSSGGVGRLNIKPQVAKLSAEEQELAKKLGLNDKDLKDIK